MTTATRYCREHQGWVAEREAVYMGSSSSVSGPEIARYACRNCVLRGGLVPPVLTGRVGRYS